MFIFYPHSNLAVLQVFQKQKGVPTVKKEDFTPGDRVVLPPYGVGVVSDIQTKKIAGLQNSYYQVDFPNGSSRAFVPVASPSRQVGGAQRPLTRTRVGPAGFAGGLFVGPS